MTRFGRPRRHIRETGSTNDVARALAEAGAPSGTIVTAGSQRAGRGRHGRVWSAPPGKALLLSAVLRPLDVTQALLPLAAPVAVCEALESLRPVTCRIKWPNDVWISEPESSPTSAGSKVAGVLIEARPPEWAVIGIGVNVAIEPEEFPADLRWPATSVGGGVGVEAVLAAVCERLGEWTGRGRDDAVAAFRERDALAGRPVSWDEGEGVAAGIDDEGNVLVERADGTRVALGSGEVSLRPG